MNIAPCTVTSMLPYEKTVYKMEEISTAAKRIRLYRERKKAVEVLYDDPTSLNLWQTIILFAGYPFTTSGRGSREGVRFKYSVPEQPGNSGKKYEGESVSRFGNEMFIEGREKSITRSSVDYALRIALEEDVKRSKALKVYGSSYIYAIFRRFGLV